MKNKDHVVFSHSFSQFRTWTLWFLPFMVIAHIISVTATAYFSSESISWSILDTSKQSMHIFALIIGILNMGGVLTYFVSNGVTRRDYFWGTSKAALLTSLILASATIIIFLIETLIFSIFGVDQIEPLTLFGAFNTFIYQLYMLTLYFFLGWFISAGFYKFHWLIGVLFCFIGLALISINETMWNEYSNIPLAIAILVSILLLTIISWLIRFLTKQVRVKI